MGLALKKLSLLVSICSAFVLVAPYQVKAEGKNTVIPKVVVPEGKQEIRYDVYAGGVHAVQADMNIDLSKKGKYDFSMTAKTYGLLGKLAPWEGIFATEGWEKKGNAYQPEMHKSEATWKDELEVKKYEYNEDGSFKSYTIKEDKKDTAIQKIDDELTQGTTDVMSAVLAMMKQVTKGEECKGSADIFDGKRRFKLIFNHKKEVELPKSKYNLYHGLATECSVEVKPVAGKWHDKPRGWISIQEQGRERGKMPTVWFAQMAENQPAIPVKVRVKTAYGTLFMHMTEYSGLNKKLVLKK